MRLLTFIIRAMIKIYLLSAFLFFACLPVRAQGNCFTPENLQVSASGNEVSFAWSGTGDADIHAILLWDKNTQQNSKAFTVVGTSFTTPDIPNGSYRWRVIALCNTANSQTDHSEWIWGNDFDFSGHCPAPSRANAGADQLDISGISTALSARNPAVGTGTWSIMSGTGGSFSDAANPASTFTGVAGNTYELRWTVSNACGSSWDDVTVSFCTSPSVADAGADQLEVIGTNTILSATIPTADMGTWTIISGTGGSFSDAFGATSTFTGIAGNTYVLRWTVSNECGSNYDDVTVSFCVPVSLSDAGADQAISSGTSTTLSAAQPSVGTGVWSVVNGSGGSLGNPSSATSSFTGTANTTYELCWTVSNACNSSTDTVMISFCTPPVSTEFTGQGCLPTGDYALSAQLADGETGTWSVIEGEGGYFSDIHDPESSFRGLPNIDYKLRWTVSNACGSAYKEQYIYRKRKYNNPYLNPNLEYGSVTDIDCNEYPTIQIGNQTWMAENLRTGKLNNGENVFLAQPGMVKSYLTDYPGVNNPVVGYNYVSGGIDSADGGYYSYGAAVNTRLCPKGWRVPDRFDSDQLAIYLGGGEIAGEKMKSVGRWSGSVTNESGFSAVPSGMINGDYGSWPPPLYIYGSEARFIINEIFYLGSNRWSPAGMALRTDTKLWPNFPLGDLGDLGSCRCIKDDCTGTLVANAGEDRLNLAGNQVLIFAGALPKYGHGQWSIVSGTGGNIDEVSHSYIYQGTRITFSGTHNTEYVLRWTVSNDCGDSAHDDITVSFCPLSAYAGADQLEISGTVTTLAAVVPQDGTGTWTIVSGAGGSFGDASQPNSSFTGAMGATYVLRWTVNGKCGSSSDDVTIHFANPYLNPDLTYGSVTDIDGNYYPTIQIGAQTWMAGNLRTTRYNDGTVIPHVTDNAAWQGLTTGAWAYYNHDENHNSIYGKLYNWYAAITGKLCPQGWHIPTRAEFNHLADYLGTSAGGKMKSIIGWNSPNTGATNESGFSGLPGGTRAADGSFAEIGNAGYWWTTTDLDGSNSWLRTLNFNNNGFNNNGLHRKRGLSCRCVKDCPPLVPNAGSDQLDLPGTSTVLEAVIPPGESGVWSIISGTGGSFGNTSQPNSTFTGTAGNTYVLRWTVSNICSNSLSDDVTVSFERENYLNPALTYGTVNDIDGNQYATIQIGDQRWMAENLRTTKYNDGTPIPNVTDNSEWSYLYTGAWSYYNNNASNNFPYGKLYNWYAVNTGKLCPTGWRIPSDTDFNQLSGYLGGSSEAGGKIKSVKGWNSPNTGATNESGFSGLPGGKRDPSGGSFLLNNNGSWWSSTSWLGTNSSSFGSSFNEGSLYNVGENRVTGKSCRCMRDCLPPSGVNAGSDKINVSGTSTTLNAVTPPGSVGLWTIVSGSGGSLSNVSSATSTFTGVAGETYQLRWTVSNECGSGSADITIKFASPYLNPNLTYGTVTDIDGNQYATIRIGAQTWMAENLKTTRYNDGVVIPNVADDNTWVTMNSGAWSYYNNDASMNYHYGKLYNWYAVGTGKICPAGWHIPTENDWNILINYVGALYIAGGRMKSVIGWDSPNSGATNESGFSAISSGYNECCGGGFQNFGRGAYFWIFSSSYSGENANYYTMYNNSSSMNMSYTLKKFGYSCRCVKD